MKKSSLTGAFITFVVALVLLVVIFVVGRRQLRAPSTHMSEPAQMAQSDLCYFKSTPVNGYSDVAFLKLSIDGTHATGELAIYPAEKDSLTGTLDGSIMQLADGTYFNGKYMNEGEGMTATDERMIKLTDTEAAIGYGDIEQDTNGTYVYKDKNALNYSYTIPKVDCADYNNLKAQAGH